MTCSNSLAMSFDAGIVGYGLSATLPVLFGISPALADTLFAAVLLLDVGLLYRYFKTRTSNVTGETEALKPGHELGEGVQVGSPGG